VHYKSYGTAPNRVCVIEWKDISITSVSGTGIASVLSNYQVRLYETTNKIEFLYANVANPVGVGGCMTARGGFFINGATSGYACLQNLLNAAATGPTNSYTGGTLGTLNRGTSCTNNTVSPAYTALSTNRQVLYDPLTGTTNAAPTDLAFTSINATDVNLTWTASATARSYDVYYSTSSSVPLDGTSGYVSAGPNATTIAATTVTPDGTTTNGTTTISFASAPTNVWVGAKISGTNIPAGATITSIQATGITISAAATGSGTSTLTTGQNGITGLTTGATSCGLPIFRKRNNGTRYIKFPVFVSSDIKINAMYREVLGVEMQWIKIGLLKASTEDLKLQNYCAELLKEDELMTDSSNPFPPLCFSEYVDKKIGDDDIYKNDKINFNVNQYILYKIKNI
jgi:hypothetical protein